MFLEEINFLNHHSNLEIEFFESSSNDLQSQVGKKRYPFHILYMMQEGNVSMEIDFEEYILQSQTIVFIPQGAIFRQKVNTISKGYVICFIDSFFSPVQKILLTGLFQYAISKRRLVVDLSLNEATKITPFFQLLIQEKVANPNQNQTFILQNLMLALLNKLEGIVQNLDYPNSFIEKRLLFQKFINLLENSYLEQKSVQFYTGELNTTAKNLNNALKEVIGTTAQDLIIDKVLLEARRELCFADKSIKEIAFSLGYDNQYYFSRIFKKKLEVSPEEFRKKFGQ